MHFEKLKNRERKFNICNNCGQSIYSYVDDAGYWFHSTGNMYCPWAERPRAVPSKTETTFGLLESPRERKEEGLNPRRGCQ